MAPFRNYDYGLRGPRQAMFARGGRPMRGSGYDSGFRSGYDSAYYSNDERSAPRANRVTARYNLDYVQGNRGERYGRNFNFFTGDRMDRMGDERWYRRPYMTIGGTRTLRGSPYPTGYDYPNYGPNYGGRYPDELY